MIREPISTYFNVHLVSDSTGETLAGVMRATCAQFDNILPVEHSYFLVRSIRQLERVLKEIEAAPGVVMFTLSNLDHRTLLESRCAELGMPCVAVLDPVLDVTSRYLGQELNHKVGASRKLNAEYFKRIDALDFAMYHDDGQQVVELRDADVILVGVSRTSKTPTSVYLAHRGVKAANVPFVPNVPLPPELFEANHPLVVGLTISADRLVHVRRNRLAAMKETRAGGYTDEDEVRREVMDAQKLFEKEAWPTIDVSRRSIEETAAAVLNLLAEHRGAAA
ncbi:MAG TPA: pyruvate, water dikinase regulatory protein [Vitreimonas sp.]|jgi:regulator of PEP synthase PpsR (kinase-PPPase family)|nr:pyruvate, water dikinase regulatory protein [Vitreimonas sp.]